MLNAVPQSSHHSWEAYEGYLENVLNAKEIGTGCFARVFRHPFDQTRVIKVGRRGGNDGWYHYAHWCRTRRNKTFLPVIHDIQMFHEGQTFAFYVAEMDHAGQTMDQKMRYWSYERRDWLTHGVRSYMADPTKSYRYWDMRHALEELGIPSREFLATIRRIRKAFLGVWRFDLHSHNWMIDSNGKVTITDPLSFKPT